MWNSGRFNYSKLAKSLARAVKVELFAKREQKNARILVYNDVEFLEDDDRLKLQDLVDKDMWICCS